MDHTNSEPVDILIIGLGAIGTIYGYILSQNPHVRVTAIARSSYEAMNKSGISIESAKFGDVLWRPYRLVKSAEEANDRPYTYIIACFKCLPDLLPTASVLAPFLDAPFGRKEGDAVNKGPTVVLIQNGIGIEVPVQMKYPTTPIISVVAWIGANLLPGPRVTHGALEKLVIGLFEGEGPGNSASAVDTVFGDPAGYKTAGGEARLEEGWKRTRAFEALLRNGGGGVEVVENIQSKRYDKVLWNASFSGLCSLSRSPVSALVAPELLPYTIPIIRRTMLEIIYIAREWGISEAALPMSRIDAAIKLTIDNYQKPHCTDGNAQFKPSMLLDVEAGRPCELEPIIGSLLDRARAKGVETPRLDLIYTSLKITQELATAQSKNFDQAHADQWSNHKPAIGGAVLLEQAVARTMTSNKQKVTGKPVKVDE